MSEAITGAPTASASTIGKPKPSAWLGAISADAPAIKDASP